MNNRWSWGILGLILSCAGAVVFACWPELRLFALEIDTGNVRWSRALPTTDENTGQPIVHDDTLVLHNIHVDRWTQQGWHRIVAYSTSGGERLWQQEIYSDYVEKISVRQLMPPVATLQTLLVNMPVRSGDPHNQLAVFNPQTGEHGPDFHFFYPIDKWATSVFNHGQTVWLLSRESFGTGTDCEQTPMVVKKQDLWLQETAWSAELPEAVCHAGGDLGGRLVANDHSVYLKEEKTIQVRDTETGALKFRIDTTGKHMGVAGELFFVVNHGSIMAYDARTGRPMWTATDICGAESRLNNVVTDNETIYIQCDRDVDFDSEYGIAAVRASNGETRWFTPVHTHIHYRPTLTANHVIVVDGREFPPTQNNVTILSKEDGMVESRFPINRYPRQDTISTDGPHAYFVNRTPRWHHWLAHRCVKNLDSVQ